MTAKRWLLLVSLALLGLPGTVMDAQEKHFQLTGRVLAPGGGPIAGASLSAGGSETETDASGSFHLQVRRGPVRVVAHAAQHAGFETELNLEGDQTLQIELRADESVTVRASADVLQPDPAASAYTREDLLPANPGRPGIPFSVPGFPTETASGGIKAPQYFAPGVAGDHGEPIAQFFQVGGYQFQNNLTANAHGNGYADPNIIIPAAVSGVEVDNAAFNARYGDHAIDLAVNYGVRDQLAPFTAWTSDGRDGDVAAGWSPRGTSLTGGKPEWVAAELSFGNGFLLRPEEREQYKLNGLRAWSLGRNALTVFGVGYYGFSRIPGLIPLRTPVTDDTIDTRQKDLTHTTLGIVTDTWQRKEGEQLVVSGFNRTYSLALDSDFGLGLLKQSEFRTVQGGNATYARGIASWWTLLAGMDYRRDAPRNLDLAHADAAGVLQLVTSNNLTITDYGPFGALQGSLAHGLRVYVGVRRDWVGFANTDKVTPANSYTAVPTLTSPKLTAAWGEETGRLLPQVSFSWAKAFHANDPRIGSGIASGTGHGALLIGSREYQLVTGKVLAGTELRLTLAHVTNAEELAKIDPDTGLQQDVGPSINRYFTMMARRRYGLGFLQASYSQADARDRTAGLPVPEAPRLIVDAIGTDERLPWGLIGKAEYEYVGEKPLGAGFRAVPIQEIRLDLERSLRDGRWTVATEGELANGASGQTLETFALPGEIAATEQIVGVPLRSYGSVTLRYQFGR